MLCQWVTISAVALDKTHTNGLYTAVSPVSEASIGDCDCRHDVLSAPQRMENPLARWRHVNADCASVYVAPSCEWKNNWAFLLFAVLG